MNQSTLFNPPKFSFVLHKFHLKPWLEDDFKTYKNAEKSLKKLATSAGRSSDRFKQALLKILNAKNQFNVAIIKTSMDVRAFTLALSDDSFIEQVKLNENRLIHLSDIRSPLTNMSLLQLISAYFKHYDKLASGQDFEFFCQFIVKQLEQHFQGRKLALTSDLAKYYQERMLIFSPQAPINIVKLAKNEQRDLYQVMATLGISQQQQSGIFGQRVSQMYYVNTLQDIEVGKNHSVLAEIVKPEVYGVNYEHGKYLGHKCLEILIDRSQENGDLSDCWRNVIMSIAGDPRVPQSSPNYQRWWQLLGKQRIEQMQIWLNKFNLKLFLMILESSARDQDKYDMERMFASRKDFILGLEEQNLIRNSRLFLTKDAERYLYQHYQRNQLPSFAKISGEASVIYLQLANGQHIIEGSHQFRIKLLNQVPEYLRIMDYTKVSQYDDSNFRGQLERYDGVFTKTHDVHLNWIYEITNKMIDSGLKLDISNMLSKENYRYYISKFGVRY